MNEHPTSVKAEDLRRTDVAWHPDRRGFAAISGIATHPEPDKVLVRFLHEEGEVDQVFSVGEEVRLKKMGIDAQLVIERLCVPEGEKASAWRSERRDDHTFHAGFVLIEGHEFVSVLAAWKYGGHIRLLPDGGEFPYSFSLADDLGLAMIDYCEGDIGVRVYAEMEVYVRALDVYARGPLESDGRRAEHEAIVSRALSTGTFPGSVEFESR
jgi:hypothetical protein